MANFRVIVVFETEVDDSSFVTVGELFKDIDRKTDEWARLTEEQFRDDPEILMEIMDSELGQPDFTVSVVPLD